MFAIKSIRYRKILNSHVDFTLEYIIELDDGTIGMGSSPQGETLSIYEDRSFFIEPQQIIDVIKKDRYFHVPVNQIKFDEYLQQRVGNFGRNNAFALSLAFYNATMKKTPPGMTDEIKKAAFPHLCLNILNGGKYAYTNPVVSDFPEYLLVTKSNDITRIIECHNRIQCRIQEDFMKGRKIVVYGNPVNEFGVRDNRSCIEYLLNLLENLRLKNEFDLMIDASAGDLYNAEKYKFFITDASLRSGDELCEYWIRLIEDYGIKYLEDPFEERDYENWNKLTTAQTMCFIIGDNFYSSDCDRIKQAANSRYTHGVIVKPNQAGTVTATIKAIQAAQHEDQIVITSHRSISTESTFLSAVTFAMNVKFIKIGPLLSDYSSIIRLNEMIRLTGGNDE